MNNVVVCGEANRAESSPRGWRGERRPAWWGTPRAWADRGGTTPWGIRDVPKKNGGHTSCVKQYIAKNCTFFSPVQNAVNTLWRCFICSGPLNSGKISDWWASGNFFKKVVNALGVKIQCWGGMMFIEVKILCPPKHSILLRNIFRISCTNCFRFGSADSKSNGKQTHRICIWGVISN